MSSNPQEVGEVSRVDPETAFMVVGGVRLVNFGAISLDRENNTSSEDTTDGNAVIIDGRVKPSGSFALYPTSASLPAVQDLIDNRVVGQIMMQYPEEDPRGTDTAIGAYLTSLDNDDIESGSNYMVTGEWEGQFLL